jgi:DNA-binding MarR family transcriptional regulator
LKNKVIYKVNGRIELTQDEIHNLLEVSDKLSSKTVTITRCLILGLLAYFSDGIQYRELKTALKASDGKLIANLNELKIMGYIAKSEVQVDQRIVDVYSLTEKGRSELNKIIEWMKTIEKVANEGEKKCRPTSTK